MVALFGRHWTRAELLERVGDVSQVGGARLVTFAEGPEAGVAVAELRTGSGLAFAVLPGRGMDIGFAEYRGMPLCWRSSTGEIGAAFYEPAGEGWLRGFSGGLMATCGLTTAGWPSTDEGQALPLHGRASYLPARNVHLDREPEQRLREVVVEVVGDRLPLVVPLFGHGVRELFEDLLTLLQLPVRLLQRPRSEKHLSRE